MKPVLSLLAGAALVTVAGTALAEEPVTLSTTDLDGVTAGLSAAESVGQSMTFGDVLSETASRVRTFAGPELAAAQSQSAGLAVSLFFGAQSSSASQSAAVIE